MTSVGIFSIVDSSPLVSCPLDPHLLGSPGPTGHGLTGRGRPLDADVLLGRHLRGGRAGLDKLSTAADLLRRRSLDRHRVPTDRDHAPPREPVTPHPINGHGAHGGQLRRDRDAVGAHDVGDAIELETHGADLAILVLLVTGVIVTMTMMVTLLLLIIAVSVGTAKVAATSEMKQEC